MAKMINADELIEFCNTERAMLHARGNSVTCAALRRVVEFAKEYAVEAEPVVHGRWILSDDKNWLTCSFCGADVDVSCGAPFFYVDNEEVSHINFCPNCGSKQDLDGGDING